MAEIDRRVSILLNALTARGFGWLAAEIIQAIEAGGPSEEQDHGVAEQRHQLELSISERQPEKMQPESSPDFLHLPGPVLGGEQVRAAVRLLIWRLSDAVAMLKRSSLNFKEIFEADVGIKYQFRDSTATVSIEAASSASEHLKSLEDEFVQWLISQPLAGDT